VSGRTGDSYISPKVQRDKITGWTKLHDVTLGQVVVEEDVSGAKPVDERELGKLLKRVESGESAGIVAFKLSRFGRGALETLQAVERIRKVGGRLVTVEDGVDSATPGGRLLLTVLAGLAEEELEQRRSGWAAARRQALERGVHVGPTPIGYRRRGDGRLEEDPLAAPLIAAAFRRRAEGESWAAIARFLEQNNVLPLERKGRKSVAWSRSGVKSVIGNRVYRGELRDGDELVCKQAHQPLVSEGEWKLAQLGGIGPLYVKDGSIAAQGLLTSLVFCAACGHRLSLTGSTAKNGEPGCKLLLPHPPRQKRRLPGPGSGLDPHPRSVCGRAAPGGAGRPGLQARQGTRGRCPDRGDGRADEASRGRARYLPRDRAGLGTWARPLPRRGRAAPGCGPDGFAGVR